MTSPAPSAGPKTTDGRAVLLHRDDPGRRYVATVDGVAAAIAEYILTDELVVFTHTETDPAFEGQGVASLLVRWALDDVRHRALAVLPACPFVSGFVGRHPEYADLVYTSRTTDITD